MSTRSTPHPDEFRNNWVKGTLLCGLLAFTVATLGWIWLFRDIFFGDGPDAPSFIGPFWSMGLIFGGGWSLGLGVLLYELHRPNWSAYLVASGVFWLWSVVSILASIGLFATVFAGSPAQGRAGYLVGGAVAGACTVWNAVVASRAARRWRGAPSNSFSDTLRMFVATGLLTAGSLLPVAWLLSLLVV